IMYYADKPKPRFRNLLSESIQHIKTNKLQSLYVFFLSCLGVTTTFQIYIYGPMQAHLSHNFSDQEIMISNITSLIVLLCVFPLVGRLSDRVNREKIMITASVGFLTLSQPFFYYLSNGNFHQLLLIQALIAIPAGAYYATVPVMLAEMFPIKLRCTALSFLYSVAASLAAGLAPLLSMILLRETQIATSPTLLVIILVIIVLAIQLKYSKRMSAKLILR
ncbi:MFS transporter, partial [Legionella tunisiensis]|uniref:MFS transporter n=1 Tax=Legionella tunisiensis TaxID=1034944 RepID=UPI0005933BC4